MDDLSYIKCIIDLINNDEDLTLENIILATNLPTSEINKINHELDPKDIVSFYNTRLIKVLDKLFKLAEEGNNPAISNIIKMYGLEYKNLNKDNDNKDNELKIVIDYGE